MVNRKIINAIDWRKEHYKKKYYKFYWKVKRFFDFSKKEKINSISVVVVGRNDNYGGDFSERLRTILDWNLSILPNPELIYVEWNQVENRTSDCDWITKRYKNTKCYIVPKKIHDTITTNNKMPVMEYFGKNVGIRKATNDWILLLNADILLDLKTIKDIKKGLSSKYVYGTHYNNIKWNKELISSDFLSNKDIVLNYFPANKILQSVVGNMILTHKNNWFLGTGYDERLTNVRAGVDENGKNNLLAKGIKPMLIGNHYHLDHAESMIYGRNDTHGFNKFNNLPYTNNNNWGLFDLKETLIKEKIWKLEKI